MSANTDRRNIQSTYLAIEPYVRRTPLLHIDGADVGLPGIHLALKLEALQVSGSFKARGAFANILARKVPSAGVAAASGSNHGAAVAYAAMRRGVKAAIFVPSVASPTKIERIRSYGAELTIVGERYADTVGACDDYCAKTGAFPIARRHVERVLLVGDDEIRAAQRALWSACNVVAEPGGAAAFGAVLSGRYTLAAGERACIVISGGNTPAVSFS